MIIKRLAGAVLALATMGLGAVLLASPAQATDGHLPVAPWAANGESFVVDATTVHLQDHVTGDTSIENPSVGLNVAAGAEISVEYELQDGATCQAGEPRLFAITNGTLDKSELCDGTGNGATSGVLSFETTSAGLVTQVGLVYSRATGHVIMSNLMVDGRLVLFAKPKPAPLPVPAVEFEDHCDGVLVHLANGADAHADASFSVSGLDDGPFQLIPGLTPEALLVTGSEVTVVEEVTGEEWSHTWTEPEGCDESGPSPEASESPAPGAAAGVDSDGDQLALTGTNWIPGAVLAGLILGGTGALLVWSTRRKPTTFSA